LIVVAFAVGGIPCLLLGMPMPPFGERINGRRLRCNTYVTFVRSASGSMSRIVSRFNLCSSEAMAPFLFRVGVQMLRDYCRNVQRSIALMTSSRAMIPMRFRR
jgi:hypothetical protein